MRSRTSTTRCPSELIAQEPDRAARRGAPAGAATAPTVRIEHRVVRIYPELLRPGRPAGRQSVAGAARARSRPLRGGGRAEAVCSCVAWTRAAGRRWRGPRRRMRRGDLSSVTCPNSLCASTRRWPRRARGIGRGRGRPRCRRGAARRGRRCRCRRTSAAGMATPSATRRCSPQRRLGRRADGWPALHAAPARAPWPRAASASARSCCTSAWTPSDRSPHDGPSAHQMHREWYSVPATCRARIVGHAQRAGASSRSARRRCGRSKTWAATGQAEAATELFIMPGYRFAVVDALLTNFHLPRSTLLMLVSAFAGRERVLAAYAAAIRRATASTLRRRRAFV